MGEPQRPPTGAIKVSRNRSETLEHASTVAVKLAFPLSFLLVVVLACRRPRRIPIFVAPTEACAQAASNLTSAQAEFVRQALVAPSTVAELLDILYLGGGGGTGDSDGSSAEAGVSERGAKRAAACRLNSARVLRSIFSEADASDVARWAP